ncbi:unnamed protein product [Polarella glacialis]|uniref:NADAR domain-containing protein n=1 Tax=Polarella glacialis TaxID=89957 RepID=A0A813LU52_POLGL|nr:unnamed protein product [Polarella glacialis]
MVNRTNNNRKSTIILFSNNPKQERRVPEVRLAGEPGVAKHLGRTLGPLRPDWDQVKRDRLQQAMREKLWAHRGPREALLSIPEGVRIVSANPADPYFGTGPDGCGQNVIGQELQKLRTFFGSYLQRRRLTLKVANVGGPWEPFSKEIDVTGTVPSEVAELAAKALGLTPEVLSVDLVTEGGFEKIPLESFGSAADLESFLAKNAGDCLAEVNLTEVAAVTLWNGTDDSYIGRADLLHLCRSCDDLLERFKMMVPLLRHTGFAPSVNFSIDDSEPRTLDEACMSEIRAAAEEMADVVISARYTLPDQPQAALLSAPEVDEPAQVVFGRHTALSPEALRDRVKGLVWGAALGDAVGLCTEFMTKAGAAEKYADPAKLSPASRVADKHRSRWGQGDWTDDTDQLVLVLDAVVAGNGVLDQRLFAKSLKQWRQNGFPELGDTAGLGIGQTVSAVLEHPAYDVAPDVAADAEWRQYGCSMAANGAVMR